MSVQADAKGARIEAAHRYMRAYLRISPLCIAIYRSVEAARMAEAALAEPMLDLGCGFGEFASVFLERPACLGLDLNRDDLHSCAKKKIHASLAQGDARRLPFADGAFASVMSVSTLEHIPDVERVIPEVFRVLRPGGRFAFTVPDEKFSDLLAVPRALSAVRLRGLGEAYVRRLNSTLAHVNLWSGERWTGALEAAGFEVERCEEIVTPGATAMWDLALAPALPERFYRIVTGRRPSKPKFMVDWLEKAFGRFVEGESERGSNLFVVARKPS